MELQLFTELKKEFYTLLDTLKEKEDVKLSSGPTKFEVYTGKDLTLFKNRKNWYECQSEVYNMLFTAEGEVKNPDTRSINIDL